MKKIHLLRLGSLGTIHVGGPEAGALDLIYSYLLQEFQQDIYNHITINHIDDNYNEVIMKERNNVFINLRYPVPDDFMIMETTQKNKIRLDVIHEALLRINEKYHQLDTTALSQIRQKILDHNFLFDLVYSSYVNSQKPNLVGKVIVQPLIDRFNFYCLIEEGGIEKCKSLIYQGKCTDHYFSNFFAFGQWRSTPEYIISGKEKIIEIHVFPDECKVEYVNLTEYNKPPLFELMRFDISGIEEEKAHLDWLHSMPPDLAAMLREANN